MKFSIDLKTNQNHPYLSGAWTPNMQELHVTNLSSVNEIPRDINGIYIRNTENPIHNPIGRYHPFDGDSMLHKISISHGVAEYQNKMVRTKAFEAEQIAGKSLWTGLFQPPRDVSQFDPTTNGNIPGAHGFLKDPASTDVVFHAGEILALHYQCGDAYRVDVRNLDTLGVSKWKRPAKELELDEREEVELEEKESSFFFPKEGISAHAKSDPVTGDLLFFNYSKVSPFMNYGVVNKNNRIEHYIPIQLPGARLPHDMCFTDNYSILTDFPLFWDPILLQRNIMTTKYYSNIPSRFGIIPRRGSPEDIKWFNAKPTFVLHFINAYEEKNSKNENIIVLDGYFQTHPYPSMDQPHFKDIKAAEAVDMKRMMTFLDLESFKPKLYRWIFNMSTMETIEFPLDALNRNLEFGTFNRRYCGKKHRYCYSVLGKPGFFLFTGIVKHDLLTNESWTVMFGEERYGSEAPFVPRTTSNCRDDGDEAEDDGYLISFITDMKLNQSECILIDCKKFDQGPVCRILLPHRISSGTHSTWIDGYQSSSSASSEKNSKL